MNHERPDTVPTIQPMPGELVELCERLTEDWPGDIPQFAAKVIRKLWHDLSETRHDLDEANKVIREVQVTMISYSSKLLRRTLAGSVESTDDERVMHAKTWDGGPQLESFDDAGGEE